MSKTMFLAKALFDNVAESPDELAFRRGDVLTVLEQDTGGLDGWWLCTMRGKQGIAPGNRLKILSGMGDNVGGSMKGDSSNKNAMNFCSQSSNDYDVPPPDRDYLNMSRRPSYDVLRNLAGSRKASLASDLYDTPPSSKRGSSDNTSGIYDTPPGSKRASSERTPPHSNRSSASRDSGTNLLAVNTSSQASLNQQNSGSALSLPTVVRRRSGSCTSSENCYETPPGSNTGSNRSSLERILSEEGPPIYETLSPTTSTENLDTDEPVYDIPPSRGCGQTQNSQMALCSAASSESLLSNTSGVSSARISQAASLPDSARSSMDLPSEIYDVPPSHDSDKSSKQLSVDSGLGFYDSPIKSRPSSSTSNKSSLERGRSSETSLDNKLSPSGKDIIRSKSLESTVDDFYDTPRNNTPTVNMKKAAGTIGNITTKVPSAIYDIPPQVTRDSVISMKSDSSDENQRLSSSSLDSEQQLADALLWDELLLDFDSALEQLVKKQQDINKATIKLASFVTSTWRSRPSLEKTLYDIKVSCTQVRNSLRDFVDFAHGATANAVRLSDYNLAGRLQKYISPLKSTLELVNRSFSKLEEMKWQVSLLAESQDKSKPDELSQIALVAKDLMPEVKKVASFIQSNGHVLFKKAVAGIPKKSPGSQQVENSGGRGSTNNTPQTKNMQHRPLPAVPGSEKCLSASLDKSNLPLDKAKQPLDKPKLSMYDIKAALHKDDYAECDELPIRDHEQAHKDVMEHCIQEYDYVQLDARDIFVKSDTKLREPTMNINKTANKDVRESTPRKSETKSCDETEKDLKKVEISDAKLDVIPVMGKDSLGNFDETDSKIERKMSCTYPADRVIADDSSGLDFPEEDLKTPVNLNNSLDDSNFILPSPESKSMTIETQCLDPNDRQVLVYYTDQLNTHSTLLANAIDAFIGVVKNKEPPNVFISHSKFVIVSAHKLVHIGDSIHRNLVSNLVSMRIMQCANHLCDCLKTSVTATKTAALQYPSPPAVQEMVDRVIAVSHAAHELKLAITQAAK